MDLVGLFHIHMVDLPCKQASFFFIYSQVLVNCAINFVLFCPHLDSFSVLFCEGLPIQLVFYSVDDQGVG